jgi:NAD(P)-dependent dehydrogenase (short-subunit alcohol dehydrogenase family)
MKKVAVITGAAGGIGSAAAEVFSKEKWYVIGVDKKKRKSIYIDYFIKGDVSCEEDSKRIFSDISKKVNKIDSLINNAAIQICKPILQISPEEWDYVMRNNVKSVYLSTANAFSALKKAKGSIVNVSSVHAIATSANMSVYAASKGAIVSFTRALAIELAKDKIRVNAILPGAVDTPMLREHISRGKLTQLKKRHLFGKIAKPEEIAESIFFLADNRRASFLTGETLVADGGVLARLNTEL